MTLADSCNILVRVTEQVPTGDSAPRLVSLYPATELLRRGKLREYIWDRSASVPPVS
ncbi:MAG: hypothetical protein AB4352_10095 [Hormoscilla sp.]